jgi:hypothetical protein
VETIRSCFAIASEAQQTLIVKKKKSEKKHNRKQQHKLERSAQLMSCQHNSLSLHHDIKCNPRTKLSIRASLYLRAGERSDCDKTQKLCMRGRRGGSVAALLHTGARRNEGEP